MAQKNATLSKVKAKILKRHKLSSLLWTVTQEFGDNLIVKHRITGEYRVIGK